MVTFSLGSALCRIYQVQTDVLLGRRWLYSISNAPRNDRGGLPGRLRCSNEQRLPGSLGRDALRLAPTRVDEGGEKA